MYEPIDNRHSFPTSHEPRGDDARPHVVLVESYRGEADMRFLGRCGSCSAERNQAVRAATRAEAELLRTAYHESFGHDTLTVVHPDDPSLDSPDARRRILELANGAS
jgi:hypothetical protein